MNQILERTNGILLTRVEQDALVVSLNRPDRGNALDESLMSELRQLWVAVAQHRSLRAVVITGSGRHFCTGADLAMLARKPEHEGDTAAEELSFLPGDRVDVPVIALVNGPCAGGGLHFVADADIAIASSEAAFTDPHVSVGQVSALEPLELLPRMRVDMLRRMVLLGRHERLTAEAALQAGLVSELVEPPDLLARGLELAGFVAANSPEAVRLSRRVLRDYERGSAAVHLDLGWELIRRHRHHPDATEGPRAFEAKRAPRWERP